MPKDAPENKINAVLSYGGQIYLCDPTLQQRNSLLKEIQTKTNAHFISPHDNLDVIAGQGTIALELLEEMPDLEAIVFPIGGGGLGAGLSLVFSNHDPSIKLIGVEPEGAADVTASLKVGHVKHVVKPCTIAKGLHVGVGELTWPILRKHLTQVHLVSDEHTIEAMIFMWQYVKMVVEPSSAVTVAAAQSKAFQKEFGKLKTALVISGGNVDFPELNDLTL